MEKETQSITPFKLHAHWAFNRNRESWLGQKKDVLHKLKIWGNSLEVQRLGLSTSTAGGSGLIPGWGTKILQATQQIKKKKIEE